MISAKGLVLALLLLGLSGQTYALQPEKWLEEFSESLRKLYQSSIKTMWDYETDLTDANQEKMVEAELQLMDFQKRAVENATKLFNISDITNATTKRAFVFITNIGTSASTDTKKLEKIANIVASMGKVYSSAKVKLNNKDVPLQPYGLTSIMAKSRDYMELQNVWKSWRDVSGKVIRKDFIDWIKLSNEAIKDGKSISGYDDLGQFWRSVYGPDLKKDVEKLLKQIMPLYKLFHAYVRRKLKAKYGQEHFPSSGTIPAHLLGNMWAQEWNNIKDIVLPTNLSFDVTDTLQQRNYTAEQMFKLSEGFFKSLGLKAMTKTFWEKSILTKIPDKTMVCHASAWDFFKKDDYRIKMCTEITMEDLIVIHHEMGHIQYYQQYADQPIYFREGANPGFHEAVGDTLALSVSTPEHLKKIGLLKNFIQSKESSINFLMMGALEKLVFLPYSYIVDTYRWKLFSGEIPVSEYNEAWWDMRCQYQGLSAPVSRTEEDFDPGSKMHIANAIPYIRYFVSHIIQFQFHEALCKAAHFTGELHKCDIYNSTEAGEKMEAMLKLGSSLPWPEALHQVTGSSKIDATPMLNYFKPLEDWLKNEMKNEDINWKCPKKSNSTSNSPNVLVHFFLLLLTILASFNYS
ncbi:angiotensin-converting enzyme isoform X1 [Octopus bimaculoides]|uniref:angiotensin-converting enzyme isoform X1 n=1 Tax=Octopus bimaculoides TaxID=37653 RepID=UPI00071D76FC|nr:angiotensin-converting enzyme isoform X1 [Octopus bimaculoides]|eukprot:XP_014771274.1 PREDICTED: angiotensin-converting enzyme-like isoform X1 [Octopus bimaculoides]